MNPCLSNDPQTSSPSSSEHHLINGPDRSNVQLDNLHLPPFVDKTTIKELLIHFHGFLEQTGFHNVANLLQSELDSNGLVPPLYNFSGLPQPQSMSSFLSSANPFSTNLLELLSRVKTLSNPSLPPTLTNSNIRLFTSKAINLAKNPSKPKITLQSEINLTRPNLSVLQSVPTTSILTGRELGLKVSTRVLMPKRNISKLVNHGRYLGHLSQVFCVTFDRTGRYVITGGDDKLIKVWDTTTGLLRYTFRGHQGELADLSVNFENTCLASGSTDKTVRVWSLKDGQPLMIFKNHKALLMAINFLPFYEGDVRYLVSASQDCIVVFYRYQASTLLFEDQPTQFEEKALAGAKMVTASYSSGGNFVITGGTEKLVYIYHVTVEKVERVYEFPLHADKIESLVWGNSSFRFASGSKDGTARVWTLIGETWTATDLQLPKFFEEPQQNSQTNQPQKKAFKLNMLCWSKDDSKVISIGNDFNLRVSDWQTGELLKVLPGHTQNAYVIKSHPVFDEVIISAGHDGKLIVWDIEQGKPLWQYENRDEFTQLCMPIYDVELRADGALMAFVDNFGALTLYGYGENEVSTKQPKQQFFSTDYDEIIFDQYGFALDLNGIPVHTPPEPPKLINADGAEYSDDIQQLVPGREFGFVTNPWETRRIVPELPQGELDVLKEKQAARKLKELEEFYVAKSKTDTNAELTTAQAASLEEEERRLTRRQKLQERRRELDQQYRRMLETPRYVLDGDQDDDEDDSSYSEGDGGVCNPRAHSSAEEEVEPDEMDSDFELGRSEHDTVFRDRTSHTVTGRRKKRRHGSDMEVEPQEENVSTTRSGRVARPPQRMYDEMINSPVKKRKKRRKVDPSEPGPSNAHFDTNDELSTAPAASFEEEEQHLIGQEEQQETRQELDQQYHSMIQTPRSVPDSDQEDDKDDSSYTEGENGVCYEQAHSSADEDVEPDEIDSDFEPEQDTVYRNRTVTGRRKRQIIDSDMDDDEPDEIDSDFEPEHNTVYRNRTVKGRRKKQIIDSDMDDDEPHEEKVSTTRSGRVARPPQRMYDEMINSPVKKRKKRRKSDPSEPGPSNDYSDNDIYSTY